MSWGGGLKFDRLVCFWVAQNEGYSFGVEKISIICLGLQEICIIFWVAQKTHCRINS